MPSLTLVKFGNRSAVTGFYLLTEQFPTGMRLPTVGRITPGQTGLQNRPRSGTSIARHRWVKNFDSGVLQMGKSKFC